MIQPTTEKRTVRTSVLAKRDAIAAPERLSKSAAACVELTCALDALLHDTSLAPEAFFVAVYGCMRSELSLSCFIDAAYQRGVRVCFPCMMKNNSQRQTGAEESHAQETESGEPLCGEADSVEGLHKSFEGKCPEENKNRINEIAKNIVPLDGQRSHMAFCVVTEEAYRQGIAPFIAHPLRTFNEIDPELVGYPLVEPDRLALVVVPLVAFDNTNNRLGYGGGNYDHILPLVSNDALVVGVAFEEQRIEEVPCEPHDCALPHIICR